MEGGECFNNRPTKKEDRKLSLVSGLLEIDFFWFPELITSREREKEKGGIFSHSFLFCFNFFVQFSY